MKAIEVKPKDWTWDENYPIRILYESEDYSVIWGKYRDVPCLGSRWNYSEVSERGFPGTGEYPTWYIEPDFFASAILQRLLTFALDTENYGYLDNINFAINELNAKLITIEVQ